MSLFNSFVGVFGLLLLMIAGVASYVFRTSTASIATKFIVPACLVMLACFTPWRVQALMGYPAPTDMRALPQHAELIGFVPHDDTGRVDLWLRQGSDDPRAYDVALDPQMKKALEEAREKLGHGERVGLKKKSKIAGRHGGFFDFDTPPATYAIDPDAFALPKKQQ